MSDGIINKKFVEIVNDQIKECRFMFVCFIKNNDKFEFIFSGKSNFNEIFKLLMQAIENLVLGGFVYIKPEDNDEQKNENIKNNEFKNQYGNGGYI